jgi:hypothetical protein
MFGYTESLQALKSIREYENNKTAFSGCLTVNAAEDTGKQRQVPEILTGCRE